MNRTFVAELTPARARLLLRMHRYTDFQIDDSLIAKAEEGRIDEGRLTGLGIVDPVERDAVQFIHDANFRAGIPVPTPMRGRATAIVEAAVKIAGLGDEVVRIDGSSRVLQTTDENVVDFDYETLMPLRKKLLLVNLDYLDESMSHTLVGKMFPRIVCVGSMLVQYSFAFGGQNSTTSRMGQMLYPAVEESVKKTNWKKNEPQSMFAMGVFPDMVEDLSKVPKKISNSLILPKTKHY